LVSGQVEVVSLEELKDVQSNLISELENIKNQNNLAFSMLLVTDIITENSVLLTTSYKPIEKIIKYKQIDETHMTCLVYFQEKQLLPRDPEITGRITQQIER